METPKEPEAPPGDAPDGDEPTYVSVELARSGGAHPVMVSQRPRAPPRPPPELEEVGAGDRLGPYYLLERIGEGGMARVFRAVHDKLRRTVAIKVLRKGLSDADGVGRFLLEARAANRARHPNLVEIFDIVEGPLGGVSYLVMEWLVGQTLLDRRRECGGRVPLKELLPLLGEAARGLHAAHEAGLVHCDLKPANVFLARSIEGGRPRAKVIDFGAAMDHRAAPAKGDTFVVGTVAYLAPEQLLGLGGDRRIDVYALGLTIFELVVGRRPFPTTDLRELVRQRLRPPPSMVRAAPKGLFVPAALDGIVRRCLAPHPAERYPDMLALAEDLERLERRLDRLTLRAARPKALLIGAPLALLGTFAAVLLDRRLPVFSRLRPSRSSAAAQAAGRPVTVQSVPSGAEVRFRGQLLGTTPCLVRLPPGRHEIELRWGEGQPSRQVIDVDPETRGGGPR